MFSITDPLRSTYRKPRNAFYFPTLFLLQDYQEIKVPLNDIPVNPCTTSELVRLCLRKQDITDDKSDSSNMFEEDADDDDDEVVSYF